MGKQFCTPTKQGFLTRFTFALSFQIKHEISGSLQLIILTKKKSYLFIKCKYFVNSKCMIIEHSCKVCVVDARERVSFLSAI